MLLRLTSLLLLATTAYGQPPSQTASWKPNKKGGFYFYWGWNRGAYTKSDITFWGDDYHFELENVISKDRQSPLRADLYLNPANMSIPQYNLRFGYYFKDNWEVSLGADHMKYVMKNDQNVEMNGYIRNSGTKYDGDYDHATQTLSKDFLMFEHTDGLNYLNVEFRHSNFLYGNKWLAVSVNYGGGGGALMPRTNTTLLNNARYDEFHLAGFGLGLVGGLKLNFWKYFFIQSEAKYGYIDMPDIRTTMSDHDHAKQYFWFMQYNILFGAQVQLFNAEKHAAK